MNSVNYYMQKGCWKMIDCPNNPSQLDHFTLRLEANAYKNCIPLRGTFELTARCNFNCKMCYVHLTESQIKSIGRELTNDEWLDIAQQAKEAGMLYLTLTGGEVFARPKFRELYEALSDMGFLIQIFSNGYLVDEEVIEWLAKRPPQALRFTLYGASNETYEAVSGVKDGFDRVTHAIELVKEAKIPFYMVGMLIKENAHDAFLMASYAKVNQILFSMSGSLAEPVRGANANVELHKADLSAYIDDEKIGKRFPKKKQESLLEYCGSYRKGFWLTWNGRMLLCGLTEEPSVSVLDMKFADAWKTLNRELDVLTMPDRCENCEYEGYCMRCPGKISLGTEREQVALDVCCDCAKLIYQKAGK